MACTSPPPAGGVATICDAQGTPARKMKYVTPVAKAEATALASTALMKMVSSVIPTELIPQLMFPMRLFCCPAITMISNRAAG